MEKSNASWEVQCIMGSPTHDRKLPSLVPDPGLASEEPEHRDKQPPCSGRPCGQIRFLAESFLVGHFFFQITSHFSRWITQEMETSKAASEFKGQHTRLKSCACQCSMSSGKLSQSLSSIQKSESIC